MHYFSDLGYQACGGLNEYPVYQKYHVHKRNRVLINGIFAAEKFSGIKALIN